MIKKIFCGLCLSSLLLNSHLSGILPPLYEGIREIKAILEDPQIGQLLQSGEVLMAIQKTEEGFLIITNKHSLRIQVIYEKNSKIGPREFKLLFGHPNPI